MKSLPITSLIICGLISFASAPALASGSFYYRNVNSNNIFPCPNNQQIERNGVGGDVSHYGSHHLLLCLDGKRKAKWIIYSYITCQKDIEIKNCPIYPNPALSRNRQDKDNTYIVKPKKTGIGINCNIVQKKGEYNTILPAWSCEKYSSRQNLTIITKSNEPLRGTGELFRKYGRIPSQFQLSLSSDCASCIENEDYPDLGGYPGKADPQTYIDCRGDAQFCDWYYKKH